MIQGALVFDLETQRLAEEVGGWQHVDRLGMSAAVTLDSASGQVCRYVEADAPALIAQLHQAPALVGYNIRRFDLEVLRPYGLAVDLFPAERIIDLLEHLHQALGFRVSLDNVASATLGLHKTASGLEAVRWYRQGEIEKLMDYCEEDVRITWRLWEHGRARRQVAIRDRDFRLRTIPVDW